MLRTAPYPVESSFFPDHFYIPLISLGIFIVILYVIARIRMRQYESVNSKQRGDRDALVQSRLGQQPREKHSLNAINIQHIEQNIKTAKLSDDFKASEIIALVGLIVSITTAIVAPFTHIPVLDYSVNGPIPTQTKDLYRFEVYINNQGTFTAEHVIISFLSNNLKLKDYSSIPFLGDQITQN